MDTELNPFLDENFKHSRRVPISALVIKTRTGAIIPRGSLVLMASGDRRIRFKVLDADTPHKGFSEPLTLNRFAAEHRVTANYLHWYLTRDTVAQHLIKNARGAVFVRVPRTFLHSIPVPLPGRVTRIKPDIEFSPLKTDNSFTAILNDLYDDYQLNLNNGRYRTAAVLSGAICELILYQLLIEQGVSEKLLREDRSLGINKMLDYVKILKLEQNDGFPLNELYIIKKNRNEAIHAGRLVNEHRNLTLSDMDAFNPVIKYFGL